MKRVVSAITIMSLTACGQNADEGKKAKIDVEQTASKSCSDLLRDTEHPDYRQAAHLWEGEVPAAKDVATAFKEVQTFAKNLSCENGDIVMHDTIKSGCGTLDDGGTRICLVATNEGQFFVHEIYPDLVSVTWNRWD